MKVKKDFLNKQLIKCINEGKLTSWLVNEVKEKSIKEIEELINIDYFWKSYTKNQFYKKKNDSVFCEDETEESFWSKEELQKLKCNGRYSFENSLCDFHESSDASPYICDSKNDDGSTIFEYNDSRRFM